MAPIAIAAVATLAILVLAVALKRTDMRRRAAETGFRRSEQARTQAEERFRRAFEDSRTGMAIVAIDPRSAGRVLEGNDALCELSGYSRDQLCEMDISAITHPDDLVITAEGMRSLIEGAIPSFQAEHRILTATGTIRWVALSTSLVRDAEGDPVHRVVQLQDISERKRFEGQLQYLADHDALTGLFNRRRFEAELERELDELTPLQDRRRPARPRSRQLQVRQRLARPRLGRRADLCGRATRSAIGCAATDTVGRLGGDEFAVILPHADRGGRDAGRPRRARG